MPRRILIVLALCGFILAPALTWWMLKVEPVRRQHRIVKRLEKKFAIEFAQDSYPRQGNITGVFLESPGDATLGAGEFALLARLPHMVVFALDGISCRAEDLENVEPLEMVYTFECRNAKHLDDAALLRLVSAMPSIECLSLRENVQITESGLLDVLEAAPELWLLGIHEAPTLTEVGFQTVADHPGITTLYLTKMNRMNEEWAALAPLGQSKLTVLEIQECPHFDDAALRGLVVPSTLKVFHVQKCAVTEEAVKEFKAANPSLVIHSDFGQF